MALAALLATATPSLLHAQSTCGAGSNVPTGTQAYHVLGNEQHIWDILDRIATGEGSPLTQDGMNSVVSAVISASSQIVYYDHWKTGSRPTPMLRFRPPRWYWVTATLQTAAPATGPAIRRSRLATG